MSNIIFKDGYGQEKVRKSTGSGTQADPFVPVYGVETEITITDVAFADPMPIVGSDDLAAINVSTAAIAADVSTSVSEYNVTLVEADTEYSQALPSDCKGVEIWSRGGYETRFAFTTGKVATPTAPYFTLKSNEAYSTPAGLKLASATIYFGTDSAGDVIEMIVWS